MEKTYTFIKKYRKRFISVLVILILIVGVIFSSLSKSDDVDELNTPKQEVTNKQDTTVDNKKEDDTNKIAEDNSTNKTESSKENTESQTNKKTDNKASGATNDEKTQKTSNTGNSNQGQKPEESNPTPSPEPAPTPTPTPEPTPTPTPEPAPTPTPKPVCEIGENPNLPCDYIDIPAGYQVMDYQKALEEMAKVDANGGGYDGGWLTRNDGQPVYFIRFW